MAGHALLVNDSQPKRIRKRRLIWKAHPDLYLSLNHYHNDITTLQPYAARVLLFSILTTSFTNTGALTGASSSLGRDIEVPFAFVVGILEVDYAFVPE